MSQQLYDGQGLIVNVPAGQSMIVDTPNGSYSAVVTQGFMRGTILADGSTTSATYGPYASGVTLLLAAGAQGSVVDYDVGVSPVLDYVGSYGVVISDSAPNDADGRPNGTIYIQTA